MQNKLLPCPFCGGEAKYIEDKDFFISRFVTCTKCGIETRRNYLRKDLAIKDWNTRKPMERILEQLEKLKTNAFDDEVVVLNDAIEIVRKGSVDNA